MVNFGITNQPQLVFCSPGFLNKINGSFGTPQVRRGIEYLDPDTYAKASYYEKCHGFHEILGGFLGLSGAKIGEVEPN